VFFDTIGRVAGWAAAHKGHVPLIAKGSLLEQMEEESQGNQLT